MSVLEPLLKHPQVSPVTWIGKSREMVVRSRNLTVRRLLILDTERSQVGIFEVNRVNLHEPSNPGGERLMVPTDLGY